MHIKDAVPWVVTMMAIITITSALCMLTATGKDVSTRGCPTGSCDPGSANSFSTDTLVLVADGTYLPIGEVRVGDHVLASDPVTGATALRPVLRRIVGTGTKDMVVITAEGASVAATNSHQFWLPESRRWSPASELKIGDRLSSGAGAMVTIDSVRRETRFATTVVNLDVAGPHTYYVHASGHNILVRS